MAREWLIPPLSSASEDLATRWRIPRLLAQILLNRGIDGTAPREAFMAPQLKDLIAPNLLPGAMQAADLIVEAIAANQKIVIYGDYDVDGTTGLSILWHAIRAAGGDPGFYVPHRVDEGYGLNRQAIQTLADEGAELVITVDCGVTAIDETARLRECGVNVIVTDHHTACAALPEANVIVHPTVGGRYPNADLCGAGVAFKLAWAIGQRLSGSDRVDDAFRPLLLELLPLAALGTIADVVALVGENRIIARHGLVGLGQCSLPGIQALIESVGLDASRIDGYDVGFKLAPRLNAAGRMGHARLAVELLTRATPDRAREIAIYLDTQNRARQTTERKIFKNACEIIDKRGFASDARRAIVVAGEGWHPGVIGIAASRLVDRYHRPAIVISTNGDQGQGSGRSIGSFDLLQALSACSSYLTSFGGHRMAAGVQIDPARIDEFSTAFVQLANNRLTGDDLLPKLRLDAEVGLNELTMPTAEAIAGLGPFGAGNPKPKLASEWIDLAAEPRCVGKQQDHLQATFAQHGVRIKAIGFGLGEKLEDLKQHRRCRVAFEPIINEFNGRRSVEMQMLDVQFPQ